MADKTHDYQIQVTYSLDFGEEGISLQELQHIADTLPELYQDFIQQLKED